MITNEGDNPVAFANARRIVVPTSVVNTIEAFAAGRNFISIVINGTGTTDDDAEAVVPACFVVSVFGGVPVPEGDTDEVPAPE